MTPGIIIQIGFGAFIGAIIMIIAVLLYVFGTMLLKHRDGWDEDKAGNILGMHSIFLVLGSGELIDIFGSNPILISYLVTIFLVAAIAIIKESSFKENKESVSS